MVGDCWLSWNWPELVGNAAYITPQPQPGSLRVSRNGVYPAREKSAGKQFVLLESNIYGDDVAKYTTTPFWYLKTYRNKEISGDAITLSGGLFVWWPKYDRKSMLIFIPCFHLWVLLEQCPRALWVTKSFLLRVLLFVEPFWATPLLIFLRTVWRMKKWTLGNRKMKTHIR